jgi:hypothetical protein
MGMAILNLCKNLIGLGYFDIFPSVISEDYPDNKKRIFYFF